jgi:Family of unknown function (DUF6687)
MFPRVSCFEFVSGRYAGTTPAISCDGLVPGAELELTHWKGNHTPVEYKADTSTEIALKFVASHASLMWAGAVVVNNHFDTDGALSAWVLLDPEHGACCRDLMIAAAEAGDFDEWPGQDAGLWLDAAIRALAANAADDAESYAIVLPQLPELAHHVNDRRDLWGAEWDKLQMGVQALEKGQLRADRIHHLGLMRHAPGEPEVPGPLLARLFLPGARRYVLAFDQGDGSFTYRYERPRYAWADTVVRPPCPAPDAEAIATALGSAWTADGVPGLTGIVQTLHAIKVSPERLVERLQELDPPAR